MKKQLFSLLLVASVLSACGPAAPQLGKDSVEDVIGAMTLEEKARLVIGTGMAGTSGDSTVIGTTKKLVPGAAGTTYPIPRLGIPAIVLADGPAGLRIDPVREGDSATYYCTHFPIGTLLASTWNQDLVEEVGKSIGNEVLEYGADVLLALFYAPSGKTNVNGTMKEPWFSAHLMPSTSATEEFCLEYPSEPVVRA